ncbi:MAG TPA: hypothetical protein VE715_01730 [Blastocatellia bacterium]|nr:hypothetical protein [Blastocatellia bacterium]
MQTIRNDSGFKMTEVGHKWFLLVGLAAGVFIGLNRPTWAMTFQPDIDALVRQSGFIFRGTVKKLNADTRNVKQDGSIVVVSIDEVLRAQDAFAPHRGRTITLQLKEPDSVKMGQQLIFFTNFITPHDIDTTFGQGFNIIEVDRMEDTATLRQQIAAAEQRLADQELQQRIDALVRQSVFIFRGTVKKLNADTRNAKQSSSIVVLSAVVSVDEALQAPAEFVHYRGRTITLRLKEPNSVKMGQQSIFFTNVIRILPGAKGFAITEVGSMEAPASSDTLRQQIAAAKQRLADQELQQRLEINAQSASASSAQPKLRLGYVKDHDVGCGSAFFLNTTDMENRRYIFSQDVDDPPYINLNGKNLQLRLTVISKPTRKEKVGDRWWETYAAGDVKVRIDYTVTKVCTPQDEMCETTYLNAIMTVSQESWKTTVKLTGYSGC